MKTSHYFKDKVVLVTGSTMGIGKELAFQLLTHGSKVVITGRNIKRLENIELEFANWKENILVLQSDVCRYTSNEEVVNKILQKFGGLDILITNAGLSCYGTLQDLQHFVAKEIIDTNIYGSLFPVKAALVELKKSKGSVLFVSSIAGLYGLPGYSAYSLSKMALTALAQSLSIELCNSGIYVGIAFVGFTENDTDKRTMTPDGEWQPVPIRPKLLTASKTSTAKKLLQQIKKKQFSITHSLLGNCGKMLIRLFPGLVTSIFRRNFERKKAPI